MTSGVSSIASREGKDSRALWRSVSEQRRRLLLPELYGASRDGCRQVLNDLCPFGTFLTHQEVAKIVLFGDPCGTCQ